MGWFAGLAVLASAKAVASPVAEMWRLEGGITQKCYTKPKNLMKNSYLREFRIHSTGSDQLCNFATHSRKTIQTQCGKPSFNCAFRGGR
jgi:hypothetical protein